MPGYEVMGATVGHCQSCCGGGEPTTIPSAMQACDADANCQGFNVDTSGRVCTRKDYDGYNNNHGNQTRWGGTTVPHGDYTWYGKNSKK